MENKLIGYADDFTLMAFVLSPGVRVIEAESLFSGLGRVSEWCDLWGMKLNDSKIKTMIYSRSPTMYPQCITCINYWRNCAKGVVMNFLYC